MLQVYEARIVLLLGIIRNMSVVFIFALLLYLSYKRIVSFCGLTPRIIFELFAATTVRLAVLRVDCVLVILFYLFSNFCRILLELF